MITFLKKAYRFFYKRPIRKVKNVLNKRGNNHKCYVCGNTFNYFSKYCGGSKNIPEFLKRLNIVGSDIDNFGCPYCSSHDRERHLFMFFDKIELWKRIPNFNILHFAPEINLSKKINFLNPAKYIKADYYPKLEDIEKIDATNIPYDDNAFDLVICNHVLEHIPEYYKAIKEIFRVLKPNGIAILQTPYSKLLNQNFEDENINTDEQRLFFYGERDHFRIFSENHFFNDLKQIGFILNILKNSDYFDKKTSNYFGINSKEDLIQVIKPSS
jgi:SAM-dependent methyltransferase